MLKRTFCIILLVVSAVFLSCESYADVTVSPSSFSIARGQATTVTLQYQFNNIDPAFPVLVSPNALFRIGFDTIGSNPVPMSVVVRGGRATAVETVVIPVGIIERVLQRGTANFSYRRVFSDTYFVSVSLTITSEGAASFSVKRIELYFDNRRAEITIPKHFPNLKAFADIRYTGTGLLDGYWEVDGRIISRVHQILTFGGFTTIQTPALPELPTFDPGTHIVRFVVISQGTGLPVPALVYFVTTDEFRPKPVEIMIKSPQEGATVARPIRFEWAPFDGTSLFLIQYYENRESKPVFSAYTKEAFYVLPQQVYSDIFREGITYFWKVTGYSEKNTVIGESAIGSFIVK